VRISNEVALEIFKHYGGFSAFVKEKIKRDRKINGTKGKKK